MVGRSVPPAVLGIIVRIAGDHALRMSGRQDHPSRGDVIVIEREMMVEIANEIGLATIQDRKNDAIKRTGSH